VFDLTFMVPAGDFATDGNGDPMGLQLNLVETAESMITAVPNRPQFCWSAARRGAGCRGNAAAQVIAPGGPTTGIGRGAAPTWWRRGGGLRAGR